MAISYDNKIRIQDLPLVASISSEELRNNKYFIDVSMSDGSDYRTRSYSVRYNLSEQQNALTNSAAKRYRTDVNELIPDDLYLFGSYIQGISSTKPVYFEYHPIVDNPNTNNMLQEDQLITKANVEGFESYLANKKLVQYASIPVFNWENEWSKLDKDDVNKDIQDTVSGVPEFETFYNFTDVMLNDANEARATYKFLYTQPKPNDRNPERVTNIIPLNKFKHGSDTISAVVHLCVAGFVSVKTDLPNQESGTIYLEARRAGDNSEDNHWQTIDSAVFKFQNPSVSLQRSPGTFVSLNGYLTTEFETRLKLNLKSQGYSMNIYGYRESATAPVTHYVNTFLGIVHIPNIKSKSPDKIYFTNINYQPYLYHNDGLIVEAGSASELGENGTDVDNIIDRFSDAIKVLKVNASGITDIPIQFKLNGLRLTPTGKIYPRHSTELIPVYPGMTIYPSYTSGVVDVVKPTTIKIIEDNYPVVYNWGGGQFILNKINYTQLSVLTNIQWPKETIISANLYSEATATLNTYKQWTTGGVGYESVQSSDIVDIPGTYSVETWATENPRITYREAKTTIDFSSELAGKNLFGDITCTFSAWPRTWGRGNGNESYGRVYSGENKLVNSFWFSTKNTGAWITKHLCTGSRWNCGAATITGECIQPCGIKSINIRAYADTAADDGRDETWFGVYLSNLKVAYNYITTITVDTTEYHESGGLTTYQGKFSANSDCSISSLVSRCVYPTKINSSSLDPFTPPAGVKQLKDGTCFNNITAYFNYANASYGNNDSYKNSHTSLTVYPFPQNLIF